MDSNLLQSLTIADVRTAYVGKPGCMCGCLGRYTTTPAARAEAERRRGYPFSEEDVSHRSVVRVLRLIQAEQDEAILDREYAYVEIGSKCYAIYFTDAAVERLAKGGV